MRIKFCVSESLFPSGEYSGLSLFYLAARNIPNVTILPEKDDNLPTRLLKSAALFFSGIAMHFFSYLGTIWHAWGAATNGTVVLVLNILGKDRFLGLEKAKFSSAAQACLIQGVINFATYRVPWWIMGLISASHAFYGYFAPDYGIEQLQKKITGYIISRVYPPALCIKDKCENH